MAINIIHEDVNRADKYKKNAEPRQWIIPAKKRKMNGKELVQ